MSVLSTVSGTGTAVAKGTARRTFKGALPFPAAWLPQCACEANAIYYTADGSTPPTPTAAAAAAVMPSKDVVAKSSPDGRLHRKLAWCLVVDGDTATIAFRGTIITARAMQDVLTDAMILRTVPIAKGIRLSMAALTLNDEWPDIVAAIIELPAAVTKLRFTGHSLGGAMALVATLYWFHPVDVGSVPLPRVPADVAARIQPTAILFAAPMILCVTCGVAEQPQWFRDFHAVSTNVCSYDDPVPLLGCALANSHFRAMMLHQSLSYQGHIDDAVKVGLAVVAVGYGAAFVAEPVGAALAAYFSALMPLAMAVCIVGFCVFGVLVPLATGNDYLLGTTEDKWTAFVQCEPELGHFTAIERNLMIGDAKAELLSAAAMRDLANLGSAAWDIARPPSYASGSVIPHHLMTAYCDKVAPENFAVSE